MDIETEPPRFLTGAEALRRTVSWALASWREQAGDAVWPDLSKAIGQSCAQHLREACARGEIVIDRAQNDAENGDLSAAVIDRGALHSLLATTPVETLYGPAPPEPANSSAIGMMTPLQAVQAALGVATGAAALDAGYARRAHRNGWLADHKNGVAVLSPATLQSVENAIKAAEDRDDAFAEETDKLWADLIAGKRIAIVRGPDGVTTPLTGAVFTSDIVPDVASGRFMPDPSLDWDSEAWEAARRACAAIGQIYVSPEKTSRRAATSTEGRAEKLLRSKLEAWLAGGGDMSSAPLKADWVSGEGAAAAGTPAAAKRVWDSVVREDPRFARLRRAGRRPGKKPKSESNP